MRAAKATDAEMQTYNLSMVYTDTCIIQCVIVMTSGLLIVVGAQGKSDSFLNCSARVAATLNEFECVACNLPLLNIVVNSVLVICLQTAYNE